MSKVKDEEEGKDNPQSIGQEKEEDVLVPGEVSHPVAAIAQCCVLDHVDHGLPKGEGAHKEAAEESTSLLLEQLWQEGSTYKSYLYSRVTVLTHKFKSEEAQSNLDKV